MQRAIPPTVVEEALKAKLDDIILRWVHRSAAGILQSAELMDVLGKRLNIADRVSSPKVSSKGIKKNRIREILSKQEDPMGYLYKLINRLEELEQRERELYNFVLLEISDIQDGLGEIAKRIKRLSAESQVIYWRQYKKIRSNFDIIVGNCEAFRIEKRAGDDLLGVAERVLKASLEKRQDSKAESKSSSEVEAKRPVDGVSPQIKSPHVSLSI